MGLAAAAALAGAGAVSHLGPVMTRVPQMQTRLPGLAGLGSPAHVALTFDDGPDPVSTPTFLAALDQLGWKATFFMLGAMVRRSPGLAAEVAAEGHEIGVHGDEHRSQILRSPTAVRDDVARATAAIAEATGCTPEWFRPPYGSLGPSTIWAARRLRLRLVLWTAWGRDWRARATPETVAAEVGRRLVPGATVLLHDSDCTSAPGAWRSALGSLTILSGCFAEQGLAVGPLGAHGMARGGQDRIATNGERASTAIPAATPAKARASAGS